MSNSLTTNPIIVDAVSGAAVTGMRRIQHIEWAHNSDHAITHGEELKITNTAGDVIVQYKAHTDKVGKDFPFPSGYSTDGIIVTTLGGGEVFIFLTPRI